MTDPVNTRRSFLVSSSLASAGLLATACQRTRSARPDPSLSSQVGEALDHLQGGEVDDPALRDGPRDAEADSQTEVGAVEDLMREHGVIRRVLVVYRYAASRLRGPNIADVSPDALRRAASLLRTFGEDYHERLLEEAHVFPEVKAAGGPAADAVDTLLAQHQRGREITDYVLGVTTSASLSGVSLPLASALESFATMYESHAAREDTIVFQTWRRSMSEKQLEATGDLFEAIERKQFGLDGFEDAAAKILAIEAALGLRDAAVLTAPPPPSWAPAPPASARAPATPSP